MPNLADAIVKAIVEHHCWCIAAMDSFDTEEFLFAAGCILESCRPILSRWYDALLCARLAMYRSRS